MSSYWPVTGPLLGPNPMNMMKEHLSREENGNDDRRCYHMKKVPGGNLSLSPSVTVTNPFRAKSRSRGAISFPKCCPSVFRITLLSKSVVFMAHHHSRPSWGHETRSENMSIHVNPSMNCKSSLDLLNPLVLYDVCSCCIVLQYFSSSFCNALGSKKRWRGWPQFPG